MDNTYQVLFAYLADILLGDPVWFPHPVRLMGSMIVRLERFLRRFSFSEKVGGILLTLITVGLSWWVSVALIRLAGILSPGIKTIVSVALLWTTLATKALYLESNKIFVALNNKDLLEARRTLSMIVGRDTQNLNESEIVRATVETIGENTSDGIIAPMFYAVLGGAPLALAYKACNTLDSMVGYKNKQYQNFGWASAKLDDLLNFLPARISGILIIAAACLTTGLNGKKAWQIFWRDRRKHPSPNSAHGEAAMAGALRIQLGGEISYQGVKSMKPLLGDLIEKLEPKHIRKAQQLMVVTSLLGLAVALVVSWI